MNITIAEKIEQNIRDLKTDLAEKRAVMHKKLTEAGITKVIGEYQGYSDEGHSEIKKLEPAENLNDKDREDLQGLIWLFAYAQDPGFENDSGGDGEFEWNVPNDCVNIRHTNIIETRQTETFSNI